MPYKIVYSSRKSISLCIKEEGLVVRAPFGTSEARIDEIVEKHKSWIEKHLEKQERNVIVPLCIFSKQKKYRI